MMSANILGLGSYYSYELVFVPIWQNIGILWSLCNITGSGQLFHYESMKWSQLKKNPKVRSLITEIENHKVDYTKSMHSYDLRYENEGKIWSLEHWKQIRSQWTILMISTQKHSISINQWIQMIFNLIPMVICKRVSIKNRGRIQWSRILYFAWLPLKQYRSDKHSVVSMLLLWYWRDDSDDCNYIIL